MPTTQFSRDSMARWYAEEHLKTDPGILSVYYLPQNAGEREIRFVEINKLIGDRNDDALEPIDFGIDMGKRQRAQIIRVGRHPGPVGANHGTTAALTGWLVA